MKKIVMFAVMAVSFVLSGCDDTPSDSMTSEVNRKSADDTAFVPSVRVVDFKKDNAWFDQGNKMRYIVRHEYNLQLTKSFGEVALDFAKELEKRSAAENKSGQVSWRDESVVRALRAETDYESRLKAILDQCAECATYLASQDGMTQSGDTITERIANFHYGWKYLSELGFPEARTTSDFRAPRLHWTAFVKTENGWVPASEVQH